MIVLVGVVLIALFVRRQSHVAHPLLDLAMFRGRTFTAALSANVVGAFVMYGAFFFTSQYLQLVAGRSPLQADLFSLPAIGSLVIVSASVPKLAARFRPGYLIAGGLVVCAAGFLLLARLGAHGDLALLIATLVVIHAGIAPGTVLGTNLIIASVSPNQSGAASGVAQTGNELGGALGIALLGALGTALYRHDLAGHTAPAAAHSTLGGAVGLGHRLPAHVLHTADLAFLHGLHVVALTCVVLLARDGARNRRPASSRRANRSRGAEPRTRDEGNDRHSSGGLIGGAVGGQGAHGPTPPTRSTLMWVM
jgi:DHA2 family multidrug resistance protein-like MFS transporter